MLLLHQPRWLEYLPWPQNSLDPVWGFVQFPFFPPPRSHKQLEQLEVKKSSLKKELILVKETLNRATLEKEVSENEKVGLEEALSKVRAHPRRGCEDLWGPD